MNSYSYSNNNPINRSDPSGKFSPQGYTQGLIQGITQQAIAIAQLVLALSTQPNQTTAAITNSLANLVKNPQIIGQSISNAASDYAAASDYEQSRLSGYYGSYLITTVLTGGAARATSLGRTGTVAETSGGTATVGADALQFSRSVEGHIFRNAPGHVANTFANRQVILNTFKEEKNLLGKDMYGNSWHASTQVDGTQVWVRSRNGIITDAGVNQTPRTFNPQIGLNSQGMNP